MSAIRIAYADAKICTERLGELHMALMQSGFTLQWTEGQGHGHWIVADEPCLERYLPSES